MKSKKNKLLKVLGINGALGLVTAVPVLATACSSTPNIDQDSNLNQGDQNNGNTDNGGSNQGGNTDNGGSNNGNTDNGGSNNGGNTDNGGDIIDALPIGPSKPTTPDNGGSDNNNGGSGNNNGGTDWTPIEPSIPITPDKPETPEVSNKFGLIKNANLSIVGNIEDLIGDFDGKTNKIEQKIQNSMLSSIISNYDSYKDKNVSVGLLMPDSVRSTWGGTNGYDTWGKNVSGSVYYPSNSIISVKSFGELKTFFSDAKLKEIMVAAKVNGAESKSYTLNTYSKVSLDSTKTYLHINVIETTRLNNSTATQTTKELDFRLPVSNLQFDLSGVYAFVKATGLGEDAGNINIKYTVGVQNFTNQVVSTVVADQNQTYAALVTGAGWTQNGNVHTSLNNDKIAQELGIFNVNFQVLNEKTVAVNKGDGIWTAKLWATPKAGMTWVDGTKNGKYIEVDFKGNITDTKFSSRNWAVHPDATEALKTTVYTQGISSSEIKNSLKEGAIPTSKANAKTWFSNQNNVNYFANLLSSSLWTELKTMDITVTSDLAEHINSKGFDGYSGPSVKVFFKATPKKGHAWNAETTSKMLVSPTGSITFMLWLEESMFFFNK